MGEFAKCYECQREGYTEIHHIIERSHASYMRNVSLNLKNLCPTCHRTGKNAVHKDRGIDLKYKIELQNKLEELFSKDFYKLNQIKEKLGITKIETEKLVKHLGIYKNGYNSKEIIFHCLGDRFYE